MLRKCCFVLLSIFLGVYGATPQVVAASMVLVVALSLQLQYLPFQNEDHNLLESIGLHACLLQLLVALMCNSVGKTGNNTLGPVSTIVLVLVMFGSSVGFFWWTLRVTIQNSQDTEGAVGIFAHIFAFCCKRKKEENKNSATTKISPVVEQKTKEEKEEEERQETESQVILIREKSELARLGTIKHVKEQEKIADARVQKRLQLRKQAKQTEQATTKKIKEATANKAYKNKQTTKTSKASNRTHLESKHPKLWRAFARLALFRASEARASCRSE